jgi:WD40 repeat protein
MLLSPDGTRVAVGRHSARAADVAVLDLSSGDVVRHAVPGAESVQPVAWSADGRWLAYLANDEPTSPYSGRTASGTPGLLDLVTGEPRTIPGGAVTVMAFAPDSSQLVVQRTGRGLEVVETATSRVRDLPTFGWLAGPAAWSPDGRHLVVRGADGGLQLIDATGRGGGAHDAVHAGAGLQQEVLGWTGPDRLVLAATRQGGGDFRVVEFDLVERRQRPLTTVPTDNNFDVSRFQLATALLPGLQEHPGGEVHRGPWPVWLQLSLVLLVLLVLSRVVGLRERRQQRLDATSAEPQRPGPAA